MDALRIKDHSIDGWSAFTELVGFVPDPMILRTGEIFLNGLSGTGRLERNDYDVWNALRQNIGGLFDFFEILVTREAIPIINYGDTFDRSTIIAPLEQSLAAKIRPVEIDYAVYNTIKKGALTNLAKLDLSDLTAFAQVRPEMDAFRYEWKPKLSIADNDSDLEEVRTKFESIDEQTRLVAQFLLGGFIFSGFAQASRTRHYIQPKRSRFFLGLTATKKQAETFSQREEDAIFAAAEAELQDSEAIVNRPESLPPILPYLLQKYNPANVRELLDLALDFPNTWEGARFMKVVNDIRADGINARRAEDKIARAHEESLAFLRPYSNREVMKSRGLEVTLSTGIPLVKADAKTTVNLSVPTWLQLWWNDNIPFGGLHKTFRRMWMAADSYNDLSGKLRTIWMNS